MEENIFWRLPSHKYDIPPGCGPGVT